MTETIKPLFPNAVTMLALAFGVSSINMSLWGHWKMAVFFIFLAGLFDFLDGKVARFLGVASRFGAELDSLSDFVSFGVAPGFLMYNWTMNSEMRVEALKDITYRPDAIGVCWAVVLFLAICCASRLARFNSMLDDKQPRYWEPFFMGVPAPAGAMLALYPLILWLASGEKTALFRTPVFAGFFVLFAGAMMASRIPTLCLKHLHLSKTVRSVVMLVFFAFVAGLLSSPWMTLSVLGLGYLVSIPVCVMVFLKLKNKTV